MSHDYVCKQCNKEYSNRTGLWKHNNKYHNNTVTVLPQKHADIPQKPQETEQDKYKCNSCNKELSRLDNLKRHEKTCNKKANDKEEIELLKTIIKELKSNQDKMVKKIK